MDKKPGAIAVAFVPHRQTEPAKVLSGTGAASGRTAERLYTIAHSLIVVPWALPVRVLTTRTAQRVLLAVAVLDISFQVQKHFFLREDLMNLGSLGGLQVSVTNLALIGLYVAWLTSVAIRARSFMPLRANVNRVTLPAALLLLFYAASLLVARDVTLGAFEVCNVLVLFLLFLYVAETTTSREDVLFIVRALLIGLILQSCLMLAQAGGLIGDTQFFGIEARADFGGDGRVSGTIGSPNPAAAYLSMMMAVALGAMLVEGRRVDKWLASIGLAMAAVPLIFTFSRGGWLSFLAVLATFMIFGGRRVPRKTVAALFVALILLAIPFRGAIEERLYGDDNGSAASRMPLNKLAGAMIADHPVLGIGANNFALAMEPYIARSFSGDWLYTVHNTYLLVWAETGVGGLIVFVWLLVAIVRQGFRCSNLHDPLFGSLALGCAAGVIGFIVQMNFEPVRSGSAIELMFLFGGLVTAMSRMSEGHNAVSQVA
jgi:putative inorganic carbon (HCO3(-)) transporter